MPISPPSTRRLVASGVAAVLALGLSLGACGSDDDGEAVREVGSGSEGSGSGGSGGSGSGGSGSGGSASAGECSPVGADLEDSAAETVAVALDDFLFDPAEISVAAGTVTFEAENNGTENHELAFLPGGGEIPMTDDDKPDEDALAEAGAFELEAFGPGQTCNATYELEPDTYTLFCIVESEDGTTHLEKGMQGELVVE